ncbi:MAG TPA: FAD-dependent oxidoreductase [Thermoanaerobaculia bacterium]|nr:FAD-dependent oxidoreductase [Thermoanaerobaculia bacterium]
MVSPSPRKLCSWMVPGYLRGVYSEEESSIDLARLVARAGGRFIAGRAVRIHDTQLIGGRSLIIPDWPRKVHLQDGSKITYDLVSFAVGSNSTGDPEPPDREPQPVRPGARMVAVRERLLELARRTGECRVVVAGGGAGGAEVALAIARLLDDAGVSRQVTFIHQGVFLIGHPERFRQHALEILVARGITVHPDIDEIVAGPKTVKIRSHRSLGDVESMTETMRVQALKDFFANPMIDQGEIPSDLTVWMVDAVLQTLFDRSNLETYQHRPLVHLSLQCVRRPRMFCSRGSGEVVLPGHVGRFIIENPMRVPPYPPIEASYARAEATLWFSLRAVLEGKEPPDPIRERRVVSLLDTGDGRALHGSRGNVEHTEEALRLKDRLDRRRVARYRV